MPQGDHRHVATVDLAKRARLVTTPRVIDLNISKPAAVFGAVFDHRLLPFGSALESWLLRHWQWWWELLVSTRLRLLLAFPPLVLTFTALWGGSCASCREMAPLFYKLYDTCQLSEQSSWLALATSLRLVPQACGVSCPGPIRAHGPVWLPRWGSNGPLYWTPCKYQ